jgi:hypothetical protein
MPLSMSWKRPAPMPANRLQRRLLPNLTTIDTVDAEDRGNLLLAAGAR